MKQLLACFGMAILLLCTVQGQTRQTTYCNPINIDYGYTPIPNFSEWDRHRATADPVKQFVVMRTEKDKRSAWIKWSPLDNAYAYNIYTGLEPDKLYNCIMVHDANEYYYKAMDSQKPYYFTIEAINENGISTRYPIVKVE
ncbi:hypothetical protein [Sphingobacterium griseoflavum]|uniref:Fibronectin type-III domain-containing protein n=1 Tax=Sphingobacterium griseoflavum TaxID=1474952 RepID=A0ABQ3HZ14_9SPHI|nr:hypothetical protein [Sphingobacterium griseoflavum]GHE33516.1 hypothetical protein GCM10017764_15810 [Sphingobacterium griseoflavum]